MNLEDEYQLAASKVDVWAGLNNIELLQRCIPGCEEFEMVSENAYKALIRAKFGPIDTKFNTVVRLENLVPPDGYSLVVSSKGGSAGMGEGVAHIALNENPEGTKLKYIVDFSLKGKMAQIGSRLVMNVVQKLANEFFTEFSLNFMDEEQKQVASEVANQAAEARAVKRNTRLLAIVLILLAGGSAYWLMFA